MTGADTSPECDLHVKVFIPRVLNVKIPPSAPVLGGLFPAGGVFLSAILVLGVMRPRVIV